MLRRIFSVTGCLLCLLLLLAVPCFASGAAPSASSRLEAADSLTAVSSSEETGSSEEAESLPPKYAPENARRNIAITAGTVVIVVTCTAVLIRRRKGY